MSDFHPLRSLDAKRTTSPMPRLLGSFFVFATLMCTVAAWSLLDPSGPAVRIWKLKPDQYHQLLAIGPIAGFGFLLLAIIMAVTSIGCFAGKIWSWRLAVIVIGINALGYAGRALSGEIVEGLVGLAIAGSVLWLLFKPRFRRDISEAEWRGHRVHLPHPKPTSTA